MHTDPAVKGAVHRHKPAMAIFVRGKRGGGAGALADSEGFVVADAAGINGDEAALKCANLHSVCPDLCRTLERDAGVSEEELLSHGARYWERRMSVPGAKVGN